MLTRRSLAAVAVALGAALTVASFEACRTRTSARAAATARPSSARGGLAPRGLAMPTLPLECSATFSIDGQRRGGVLPHAADERFTPPASARGKAYVRAGFIRSAVYALHAQTGAARATTQQSAQGHGVEVTRSLRGRATRAPLIRAAPPVVMPMMAPDTVRRTVMRNLGQVRACYDRARLAHRGARGRVVVRFVIMPDGHVASAVVAEDSLGLPEVATCVTSAVRAWLFSPPPSGGIVMVNYPFLFEPPAEPPPGSRRPVVIQPW